MKIKGISVFERHIEKIVFAVFFLALLGVFGAQFFVPSTVKVGGKEVAPAKAGEIAAAKARLKVNELESQRVHEDIPASVPDLRTLYSQTATPGADNLQLMAFGTPQLNIDGGSSSAFDENQIDLAQSGEYESFEPPSPERPIAMTFGGTLDPAAVQYQEQLTPGFSDRLGLQQQPYDVRAVSIQTTIDTEQLRAVLTPLPSQWWDGRVRLLDVELLRQQQLADGSWGPALTLAKSPGQRSLTETVQNPEFSPADLSKLLDEEAGIRAEIRNPRTIPTISGEQWLPPALALEREAEFSEITPEERSIQRKMDQLEKVRRKTQSVRDAMEKSAAAPTQQPVYYAQGGRGGGGGGPGGRGGGREGGGGTIDPEQAARERKQKIRETNQKRIDSLLEQEQKLIDQIVELGGDPDGVPEIEVIDPEQFRQPTHPLTAATRTEMTLWAHDYDAVPGSTYRYAVRYSVTNPFFGKSSALTDEQKSLAEGVAVVSEPSEWTDPVRFEPDVQYFVSSARVPQRGQFGASASAEFEVFQFYYGYWRKGLVRVGLGEPIIAEVELPEQLVVFEFSPEDPDADPTEIEVDPATISRMVDAYLVDVLAGVAGQNGQAALIASSSGEVVKRLPAADKASLTRERLAASSELGMTAGAPALDGPRRPDPREAENRENDTRRESERGGSGMDRDRR